MIILVDGINKSVVKKKAEELAEELHLCPIDMSGLNFESWIRMICLSGEDMIFYNTFISDQAESMIKKEEPLLNTNEIIAIVAQFGGKAYVEYIVDDDAEKMYEQTDKSITFEEFKEHLMAYNASALSMKALMPVVPHKE